MCCKKLYQAKKANFDFKIETSKKKKVKNILQYKSFEELDLDLKHQDKLSMKLNLDYNVLKVDNLKMFSARNFEDTVNLLCPEKNSTVLL